ncbi:hypothetical protein B0T09DRAFT_394266 [Sordaria sp. MPI-SDFR-AT-0083]|nr:hypothetical protein B0T09DRAFT_394266 [Sordaria sp. MPI-SDFR-AT-0083]
MANFPFSQKITPGWAVSGALQGGLYRGVGCTGLIVGGLATVFQDLAEGLACLLAGFCFSIWLLTLRSGGLIQLQRRQSSLHYILSLASFCLYFTRWTRNYGLIASISFSGATAAVLGLDCFARAGNPADHQRGLEAADEKAARQLEEARARELREWERKYGDGKTRRAPSSEDSGLGDMDGRKANARHSQRSTSAVTTTPLSPQGSNAIFLGPATAAGMAFQHRYGSPTLHEKEMEVRENDGRRVVSSVVPLFMRSSQSSVDSNSGPGPLPLEQAERRAGGEGRPGNDEENGLGQTTQRRSTTIIRRLSNGSAKLFWNLSEKSTNQHSEGNQRGESREGLVAKTWKVRNDTDSVAVNLDDLGSVSGDEDSEDDQREESNVSSIETQNNKDTGKQKDLKVKPTEEITDKTLSEAHGDQSDHSQVEQEAGIPSTNRGYALMFNEPYEYKEGNGKEQPVTTDVPASVGDSGARSSGMPNSDELSLVKSTLAQELSPIALLQQTATSASVPRAIPKTTSLVTEYLTKQRDIQRSSSGPLLQRYPESTYHAPDHAPKPEPVATTRASPYRSASETLNGLTSRLFTETIAEEGGVQGHQRASAQASGGGHLISRGVPPEVSAFPSTVDPLALPPTLGVSRHRTTSTLIDTREALLRSKSQGLLFNGPAMDALNGTPAVQSQLAQGTNSSPPIDIDDIPLSQRRKMIRQSSLTYESKNNRSRDMLRDPDSSPKLNHQSWIPPASTTPPQPARPASNSSSRTSDAVRQAKLANFRNSVAADLRVSSSRNVLNNNTTTSPILPPNSSPVQQSTTVFDPYSFNHQLGVITQPQTQTQQIHPGMGLRSSTQRNTYGYGQQLQLLQDPSTTAGAVLETQQRRNSGQTQLPTQVAQAHRAHRAHRDAMRRLQAGAKAD